MTLRVLGAGFGRTGTFSLKLALETLGFGPCYHMVEVAKHRTHAASWAAAARAEPVDWEQLFAGYAAAVDWPATTFWRAILAANPDARVVLTVRDSATWYASFRDTILEKAQGLAPPKALPLRSIYDVTRDIILDRTFGGRAADMHHAVDVYERHNRDVLSTVSPDRLLVYEPSSGWAPLCAFLGCAIPDVPFPHANTRDVFQRGYADLRAHAAVALPPATRS